MDILPAENLGWFVTISVAIAFVAVVALLAWRMRK